MHSHLVAIATVALQSLVAPYLGLETSQQQARNGKQSKQELKSSGHFATRVVGAVCNWGCLGVSQVLSRISCPLPVVASRPSACKQGYALRASTRQTPRPREATLSSHAVAARPHARCPARTPRVVLLLWKRSGCGSVSAVQAIAALSTAHCIHHRQRADKRLDRQEQALHCAARTPHPADMQQTPLCMCLCNSIRAARAPEGSSCSRSSASC